MRTFVTGAAEFGSRMRKFRLGMQEFRTRAAAFAVILSKCSVVIWECADLSALYYSSSRRVRKAVTVTALHINIRRCPRFWTSMMENRRMLTKRFLGFSPPAPTSLSR